MGTTSTGETLSVEGSGGAGGAGGASMGGTGGTAGIGGGGETGSPPVTVDPCETGQCWSAPTLSSACGVSTVSEGFSTGKYNVHEYALLLPKNTKVDLKLDAAGESWSPALIVNAADNTTLYDGANGTSSIVTPVSSGQGGTSAELSLTATTDEPVSVFVTSWGVIDSGFAASMSKTATYALTTMVGCEPPMGALLSPPNFDPNDEDAAGFFLLPDSSPPGLYTHKAEDCSRGTKRLIDVLYTVATHWQEIYPSLAPLKIKDLNEGSCSTVDHATHADGTHADLVAGCATDVTCADKAPKLALAKLFVDTGVVCGILNNDTAVHDEVNAYFAQKTDYAPWKGQFMRSVDGHVTHFHVRVKKPDGTCD